MDVERRGLPGPRPTIPGRPTAGVPARRTGAGPVRRGRAGLVAVPVAVGALVLVQAVFVAARLPASAPESLLVDAARAALHPVAAPAAPVGLDALAARVQLSAYARWTGAFERHPTALGGARELGVLACAVLVAAMASLTRVLAVRPPATAVVFGALAAVPAAVAPLVVVGPGLLGAAWLTAGVALLARRRRAVRALGVLAVVAGVASAPVLAVPVLVGTAAVLVALRNGRSALFLQLAILSTVVPLALLPPPGGAAAVPTCVVVAVLVGLVLVDEALGAAGRGRPVRRRTGGA